MVLSGQSHSPRLIHTGRLPIPSPRNTSSFRDRHPFERSIASVLETDCPEPELIMSASEKRADRHAARPQEETSGGDFATCKDSGQQSSTPLSHSFMHVESDAASGLLTFQLETKVVTLDASSTVLNFPFVTVTLLSCSQSFKVDVT